MSADIEILDDEKGQWVNLTIRAGGCIELDICVPQRGGPTGEATVRFDLHKKDHTEAIKKLISHLQHQLEIATDLFPETMGAYRRIRNEE